MKVKHLILAAALTLAFTHSCRENIIEIDSVEKEIFLRESAEGIYKEGKALFLYREDFNQKAVNPQRVQYRIQTDEQDTCLNVTMEALPATPGVHVTTSIDYRSPGDLISSMTHLECSRMDNDKIWMWDRDKLIGIIINTAGI